MSFAEQSSHENLCNQHLVQKKNNDTSTYLVWVSNLDKLGSCQEANRPKNLYTKRYREHNHADKNLRRMSKSEWLGLCTGVNMSKKLPTDVLSINVNPSGWMYCVMHNVKVLEYCTKWIGIYVRICSVPLVTPTHISSTTHLSCIQNSLLLTAHTFKTIT